MANRTQPKAANKTARNAPKGKAAPAAKGDVKNAKKPEPTAKPVLDMSNPDDKFRDATDDVVDATIIGSEESKARFQPSPIAQALGKSKQVALLNTKTGAEKTVEQLIQNQVSGAKMEHKLIVKMLHHIENGDANVEGFIECYAEKLRERKLEASSMWTRKSELKAILTACTDGSKFVIGDEGSKEEHTFRELFNMEETLGVQSGYKMLRRLINGPKQLTNQSKDKAKEPSIQIRTSDDDDSDDDEAPQPEKGKKEDVSLEGQLRSRIQQAIDLATLAKREDIADLLDTAMNKLVGARPANGAPRPLQKGPKNEKPHTGQRNSVY